MLDASVVLQLPPFSLMKAMRRAFVTSPRGEKHRGLSVRRAYFV